MTAVATDWRAWTPDRKERLLEALRHDWPRFARPNQLPPDGDWRTWLVLAGRGFGKTRTGAEWIRRQVEKGLCRRVALIAPTSADARDVMVEGESGLMSVCPSFNRPHYEPSKRRLTWPNGALATTYSADEPERLRGPQHDLLWADELAAWNYPQQAWDMAMFGLRLGNDPRALVTTTPKPLKLVRDLVKASTSVVTRGSTYENRANLAPAFFEQIVAGYEGTRIGRQELHAEILDDAEGALWTYRLIDESRVDKAPELQRVVVAIDPAVTSGEESDLTGIVVVGQGIDGHGYVLEDLSGRFSPDTWASRAVTALDRHEGDRVVAEVNNGGDMVESTLRTVAPRVPYRAVRASRGKRVRAEPVAALYEQGRVHHVGGYAPLEDQLCTWTPDSGDSPDRLDALVWGLTDLMLGRGPARSIFRGVAA